MPQFVPSHLLSRFMDSCRIHAVPHGLSPYNSCASPMSIVAHITYAIRVESIPFRELPPVFNDELRERPLRPEIQGSSCDNAVAYRFWFRRCECSAQVHGKTATASNIVAMRSYQCARGYLSASRKKALIAEYVEGSLCGNER